MSLKWTTLPIEKNSQRISNIILKLIDVALRFWLWSWLITSAKWNSFMHKSKITNHNYCIECTQLCILGLCVNHSGWFITTGETISWTEQINSTYENILYLYNRCANVKTKPDISGGHWRQDPVTSDHARQSPIRCWFLPVSVNFQLHRDPKPYPTCIFAVSFFRK